MERAGRLASVYVSGEAVPFTFENLGTFEGGIYMLPLNPPFGEVTHIWEYLDFKQAEIGTTTTNVKITNHGLVTGDVIMNSNSNQAIRIVTKVDNNNLTVSAIVGQTPSNYIQLFKIATNCTINLTKGTITSPTKIDSGQIMASGTYYPITCVATAHDFTFAQGSDLADITPFLATHKKRMPLNNFAYGTLSTFDVMDSYFSDALTNGKEVFIDLMDGTGGRCRTKALIDKTEMKAAIANPQTETVSFISANDEVV